MSTLKNPCRECDHHLSGGSKNVCECTNCEERIAYVNTIGTCPSESVNENVSLEGGGDIDDTLKTLNGLKTLNELEQMNNQKTIINPIEDHIDSICQDAGITVEQIRANAKEIRGKQARLLFHETRDRIIKSLASGDFGKLNQTKIGKYLGISNHGVSMRMKIMGIAPGRSGAAKKQKKPKAPAPAKPTKGKKTSMPAQPTVRLDFTEYPEIYNDLVAMAAQEIRTIEGQTLYILKQVHERGLNIPEA